MYYLTVTNRHLVPYPTEVNRANNLPLTVGGKWRTLASRRGISLYDRQSLVRRRLLAGVRVGLRSGASVNGLISVSVDWTPQSLKPVRGQCMSGRWRVSLAPTQCGFGTPRAL
jgi:hypothetical protein